MPGNYSNSDSPQRQIQFKRETVPEQHQINRRADTYVGFSSLYPDSKPIAVGIELMLVRFT